MAGKREISKRIQNVPAVDFAAIDQWRIRHELLKQALMSAQRKLKGRSKNKVIEAIELIDAALVTDKRGTDAESIPPA